jgi:tetratricopeptide (TPR) repeat protein
VHLALGGAYSRLGRHADAKASFIRAIQMRPDSTDGHYGLGMAYIALGRRDLALDEYKMLRPLDETLAGRLFAALYGE